MAEPLQAVAAATGDRSVRAGLFTGGEDHALAATFPDQDGRAGGLARRSAPVRPADDDHAGVLVDGAVWESAAGFDHFRSPQPEEPRR